MPRTIGRFSVQEILLLAILVAGVLVACELPNPTPFLTDTPEDCTEDEIWDGAKCVNSDEAAKICMDLPDARQAFCRDIVQKRFVYYKRYKELHEMAQEEKQKTNDRILAEIGELGAILDQSEINVHYICAVQRTIIQCAELSSVFAFYDNKIIKLLLSDIRGLQLSDAEARGEIFISCNDSVFGTTKIEDVNPALSGGQNSNPPPTGDPGGSPPPVENTGGSGSATGDWQKGVFSKDSGSLLEIRCSQFSKIASGSTVVAALGLRPIGSDTCGKFDITGTEDISDEISTAFQTTIDRAKSECNSIAPANVLDDILGALATIFGGSGGKAAANKDAITVTHEGPTANGGYRSTFSITNDDGSKDRVEFIRNADGSVDINYDETKPSGLVIVYPTVRVPPPKDCADPIQCASCHDVLDPLTTDAAKCISGSAEEQRASPVCRGIAGASACCSLPSDQYTDPRIIMPNPQGDYACYATPTEAETLQQYCDRTCNVAAEQMDCVSNCQTSGHPMLEYNMMDVLCTQMYSENCYTSELPFTLPDRPIPGPPLPTDFTKETLIPGAGLEISVTNQP